MSNAGQFDPAEPAGSAIGGGAPATLVATRAIAAALRPPGGLDPEPRWSAARLPIVERDSYEIAGEIAHGGVGRILRGRSVHLDRLVAVKELLEPGDAAADRFVCEALLTARLQHPSIVPVYEAGRWPTGELFYAMKLVSGRSLADVLAERPRPLPERLGLLSHVVAVAEAMAYAHSERIIHRDLKPANVLVGSFGETVVIDWGLAKDLAGEAPRVSVPPPSRSSGRRDEAREAAAVYRGPAGLTMAGAVMGTPAYMPPEQAQGLSVDERADVYAIGAILYHLLAGAPPYEGRDVRELLRAVCAGPPPSLSRRERALSHELCTIVDKAMARDPAARYPSAGELAADLRSFMAGQVVGAHKYTRSDLVLRVVRRFRAPLAVAAAALVALAGATAFGFQRIMAERDRAEQQRRSAEAARREALAHADDLTLVQARASASREPDRALRWLGSLSPSFDRWSAARVIAADAAANGLAAVLRGHTESLNAIALSPDGRLFATTSDDHTARLWEQGQSRVLAGHADEVWGAAFSPDGRTLATGSKDTTIRLWDVATGEARTLTGHTSGVSAIAFLRDGRLLSGSYDDTVRLWDPNRGEGRVLATVPQPLQTLAVSPDERAAVVGSNEGEVSLVDLGGGPVRKLGVLPNGVRSTAFSPDGAEVAVRASDGYTVSFRLPGGEQTLLAQPPPGTPYYPANGLAYSPDGRLLAFGGEGSTLVLLDRATGARRTLDGREGRVGMLSFSRDGRRLAAGCGAGAIQIWDVARGVARTLHGFEDVVIELSFTADGRTLAAASYDHTARLFPIETGDDRVLDGHGGRATFAAFSPDGEMLATADTTGAVRLWDIAGEAGRAARGEPILMAGHDAEVIRGAWSLDGSLLVTVARDGSVLVWDRWGHLRRSGHGKASMPAAPAFSGDGRLLAWADVEGVRVADLDAGSERAFVGPHVGHQGATWALAFSPDGAHLATGSGGDTRAGVVELWDTATGEGRTLLKHDYGVGALAFSPDGSRLASGGTDHTLRVWSAATGAVQVIDAGGGGIMQLAFSPDGATIYSQSGSESGVRAWDARTGQPRGGLLRGHDGGVNRFALSPDGTRLATAGVDQTVRLWDLATGESRALRGHGGVVSDVAFSPDGRTVASASADGTVRLWLDDLPTDPEALQVWIHEALRAPAFPAPTPRVEAASGAGRKGS